jgi:hypothetical protein
MEKFQELRDIGERKLEISDHMLTQTYRELKDPKLLIAVLENIFQAMSNLISAVLYYDRTFKYIPAFQESPEAKLAIFETKSMQRHHIDNRFADTYEEIRETILLHKNSPVEFKRNDKMVICDRNYAMKTVSFEKLKSYIYTAKEFVMVVERVTKKNENIFKKNIGAKND